MAIRFPYATHYKQKALSILPPAMPLRLIISLLCAAGGLYLLYRQLWHLNQDTSEFNNYLHPGIISGFAKSAIFIGWLCAIAFLISRSRRCLQAKGRHARPEVIRRLWMAGILFCISVVAYDPPTIELAPYFFINSAAYALLIYAVCRIPQCHRIFTPLGRGLQNLLRLHPVYLNALAYDIFLCTAYYLSFRLFQHIPLNVDTCAQLVHAKMLLAEKWWYGPTPPLPQFFYMFEMVDNHGKWYSQYPPGHVVMLAIGLALGHPEAVNPFLGACTCIAIYLLAKELYGAYAAKIALLLSVLCAYMLFLSSEYMMNATTLLLCTLFLWCYFRILRRPRWHTGILGGIALGYCFTARPYTVIEFALPAAIYGLYLIVTQKPYRVPLLLMAAAFLLFVAFLLYYNDITNGNPFLFGYQLVWGYGSNPLTGQGEHSVIKNQWHDLRYNLERLTQFNRVLFEWPVPALFPVALAFAWRGSRRHERLLFATLGAMFLGCQLMPGNVEREWGPRLAYEITGILIVLYAKALATLPAALRILSKNHHPKTFYYGAGTALLLSFYVFSFQHNFQTRTIYSMYRFYDRGTDTALYDYVERHVIPPALVFIPGWWQYVAVSFTNPPTKESPVIYARDLGKRNALLMQYYPERHVYWATETGNGPQIKEIR